MSDSSYGKSWIVAQVDPHIAGEIDHALESATEVPASEHGTGFPPFDPTHFASQLLWLAITFGVFYWVMSKVALPRLSAIIEDRQDRIAWDLGEAARLKSETDAAIAGYEQALADARKRAGEIGRATHEKVAAEIEAKKHDAEKRLSEKLSQAESEIAGIKSRVIGEVDAIALETAEAIVQALVGKSDREQVTRAVATELGR